MNRSFNAKGERRKGATNSAFPLAPSRLSPFALDRHVVTPRPTRFMADEQVRKEREALPGPADLGASHTTWAASMIGPGNWAHVVCPLTRISHQGFDARPAPVARGSRADASKPREMRAIGETAPEIDTRTWSRFWRTTATRCGLASRPPVSVESRLDGAVSLEPGFLGEKSRLNTLKVAKRDHGFSGFSRLSRASIHGICHFQLIPVELRPNRIHHPMRKARREKGSLSHAFVSFGNAQVSSHWVCGDPRPRDIPTKLRRSAVDASAPSPTLRGCAPG